MDSNTVKQILIEKLNLHKAIVSGEKGHFQIIVVGEMFHDMSRIEREKAVYVPLMEYIVDNRIHAVSIRAYTPAEWMRHYSTVSSFKGNS